MIREEIRSLLAESSVTEEAIPEISLPQPYKRPPNPKHKLNKDQVNRRKSIGNAMLKNPKVVAKFKKKYSGEDKYGKPLYISHIWMVASSKANKKAQ